MSFGHRLAIVLALAGLIVAPLLTFHPIAVHLLDAGRQRLPHELTDGAVLLVFGMVGASLVQLINLTRRMRRWFTSAVAARNLAGNSTPASLEGIDFRVVPLAQSTFFTTGIVRPRIYVSSAALDQLPNGVLLAGLLHERAHQQRRDVAWRAALSLLDTAFRPLPLMRRTIAAFALECELAADRAALAAGARRADLFDAVVAASGNGVGASGVGLASVGTMERLNLLLDDTQPEAPYAAAFPLLLPGAALTGLPVAAHLLFWVGLVCL